MVTSNSNVIRATFILEMYAKCGSLNIARDLLNKMPKGNIFAWKCYHGEYRLMLIVNMRGIASRLISFSTCLQTSIVLIRLLFWVCRVFVSISALWHWERLFMLIYEKKHYKLQQTDITLAVAFMEMYAKNGELGNALKVFNNSLGKKDVVMWTRMIMV